MILISEPIIRLKNIVKQYPGVTALDDFNLEIQAGEVHVLAGENGAGKSTLIKIIAGAIEPSKGIICIGEREYQFLTPKEAKENGISVIYQEFNLVNQLSIWENIYMGRFLKKNGVLDKKDMINKTRELFQKLDVNINPNTKIADLTVAYQQMVEIAKAMSQDAKILIMDEPSAPLSGQEVNAMFQMVRTLKEYGVTIIYITHRMEEIFELGDRVSVMRDGKFIKTLCIKKTTKDELITLMIGRELDETFPVRKKEIVKEVILKTEGLFGNGLRDISFTINKGEILGIGGLVGAGRTELAEMLFGVVMPEKGSIEFKGKKIIFKNPRQAINEGIVLVPEDRKRHGVLLHLSIMENIMIPSLRSMCKCMVLNKKKEKEIVNQYTKSLHIKTPDILQLTRNLSGGNQQKVVLAKWLATDPDIIIFDEPTRGIDVGAKNEIYHLMMKLAEEGKTIIMISSEMQELIGLSDRIIVLSEGTITGILEKEEFGQDAVLRLASI